MSAPRFRDIYLNLECAIARGWDDEQIHQRTGATLRQIREVRARLDALVAEDPPFVLKVVR